MLVRRSLAFATQGVQCRNYVQLQSHIEQPHFRDKVARVAGAKEWMPHASYVMSREKQLFDMWKHEAHWTRVRVPLTIFLGVAYLFKA